jgi:hypothetical protein
MEVAMRKHHILAVVAVLLIGLGVKQYFYPPVAVEADTRASNMSVLQMHIDHPKLPAQVMHDMTLVFDSE